MKLWMVAGLLGLSLLLFGCVSSQPQPIETATPELMPTETPSQTPAVAAAEKKLADATAYVDLLKDIDNSLQAFKDQAVPLADKVSEKTGEFDAAWDETAHKMGFQSEQVVRLKPLEINLAMAKVNSTREESIEAVNEIKKFLSSSKTVFEAYERRASSLQIDEKKKEDLILIISGTISDFESTSADYDENVTKRIAQKYEVISKLALMWIQFKDVCGTIPTSIDEKNINGTSFVAHYIYTCSSSNGIATCKTFNCTEDIHEGYVFTGAIGTEATAIYALSVNSGVSAYRLVNCTQELVGIYKDSDYCKVASLIHNR